MNEFMRNRASTRRNAGAGALRAVLALAAILIVGFIVGVTWSSMRARDGTTSDASASAVEPAKTLWTCGMHPQVIQDHPGDCPICHMKLTPMSGAGASGSSHGIVIDPVIVQNMGVRTALVRTGTLQRTVRAAGVLYEPDPNHLDINLRVSGWIEKLYAAVDGMHVQRGDPLFELYSPELQIAIEELLAASRARATPKPTPAPAPTSAPGADSDRVSSRTSDALYAAAYKRLELAGLAPEQIEAFVRDGRAPATVTIVSPMTGHVTEKSVYPGAAVKAGERVLRLADQTTMWLDVQVFEAELPFVQIGQRVTARTAALPGERLQGGISFIHPHLDEMTRAARVRVVLPNPTLALRQGMYAEVGIASEATEPRVLAPREAVIDTGERQVAFVALDGGRFEPRDVEMGRSGDGGLVEILSGLADGELVVTSGQFLIDSESRIREAIQKHLHAGLAAPVSTPRGPTVAQGDHTPVAAPRVAVGASEAPQSALDTLYGAYFDIEKRLGAMQTDERALDVQPLVTAASDLASRAQGGTHAAAERVRSLALEIASLPLGEQRERWKALSDVVIALAQASPPSRAVAARVYVMHCPMAPGSWLQADDEIANPYYGTAMKQCGEIVRTIEASEER